MNIRHNCYDWDYLDKGVRDIWDESPMLDEERDDGLWVLCDYVYIYERPFPDWCFILWGSYSMLTCDSLFANWSRDTAEIPF